MKKRLLVIAMAVLVMIAGLSSLFIALQEEMQDLPSTPLESDLTPSVTVDQEVFARSDQALDYRHQPDGKRSLAKNYEGRAYPGAPPVIPHPVLSEKGMGGKNCLQCHRDGGYSTQFEAYAPVVPHPNYINCRQCHVPQTTTEVFEPSDWEKPDFPELHQVALEGGPPRIPHDLQLRGNCLSCHAGSAAPEEIRTSHPERINCRQCHVPIESPQEFVRPVPSKQVQRKDTLGKTENTRELVRWMAEQEPQNEQR